jgi:hypothetical protein
MSQKVMGLEGDITSKYRLRYRFFPGLISSEDDVETDNRPTSHANEDVATP